MSEKHNTHTSKSSVLFILGVKWFYFLIQIIHISVAQSARFFAQYSAVWGGFVCVLCRIQYPFQVHEGCCMNSVPFCYRTEVPLSHLAVIQEPPTNHSISYHMASFSN